jgi:hypothetical protein
VSSMISNWYQTSGFRCCSVGLSLQESNSLRRRKRLEEAAASAL